MKEGKRKILFVVEQRGGVDIFLPVIKKIQKNKRWGWKLLSSDQRIIDFAKRATEKKDIDFLSKNASPLEIGRIIEKINPGIIFTDTNGTKFNFSIDKKFIATGKEAGIPVICIVDSWMNYKARFGEKLQHLPDKIFAIDEEMYNDLYKIGIKEEMIEITGSPRFDRFSKIKKIKEVKNLIIFNSQPIPKEEKLNEVKIFKDIVGVLEKKYPGKKIIITFHPTRENDEKSQRKYDNIKSFKLIIEKAKEGQDTDGLNRKAELVVGIQSTALIDASIIKKRVLSYQPGKNIKNDKLQSNRYGWSVPVYRKEDLAGKIKNLYEKKVPAGKKKRSDYTKNNSTQKVLDFIKTFADKCHHGKEENLLFPAMEEAGIPKDGGPIGVMLEEHDIGRNFVKGLAEAIARYKKGERDAGGKIAENAENYVDLLSQHIDKENSILYPIARDCLSPKKQEELLVKFAKVEENIVGHGKHEEFHRLLEELKKIYLAE